VISDILVWEGREIDLFWHEETDFSKLGNVTQVYGFLFIENGKICIVSHNDGRLWALPGGGPEPEDKSYEETLIRESDEEADIEIANIKALGYIEGDYRDKPQGKRQHIRMYGEIIKINEQTIDPAYGKILLRKFIKPEEFLDYCPWGKTGKRMIEMAVEVWESSRK
jgi:8-oxo-dGTP pyrophosphatase MutT (NUDIX family)